MRYKKYKEEKESWPPIKIKSYTTLALVLQKDLQTKQEATASIYLRVKGDIHKIPQTIDAEAMTDITQIFDPVSGRVPSSILIEGHPGFGKTTIVKTICIQWAEGNLLTSDKLVLLLMLRDPKVQKISNEQELIQHFTNYSTTELRKELIKNHGADVTLIIDGFDELSTELRDESFFRDLIEKESLPCAKVVVTSRPSASGCLHEIVDKRIEILGFEQSSKNQYVIEALQDSPSKLEKLQRHFQLYPNIDALCYIPLIMSIIVYLCMCQADELPPTATKMYASFILHTICHYLKKAGKISGNKIINKLEQFPPVVHATLQQLEKTAFDGLIQDKIVFTVEELPPLCVDDPTCYGLLQSTECYSAEEIGTATQSFNFLHMGIQEYFAAKYVTTLPEDEVYKLLRETFITDYGEDVRLSNMWILYCGITSGQCKTLRHYLTTYGEPSSQGSSSDQRISNIKIISQHVLKNTVKVLYLFQCFQEAQDSVLCEALSKSFNNGVIHLNHHRLLPYQVVSLGFFLSRSHKKWNKVTLSHCKIGDHGISILHQYICGDEANKQAVAEINLNSNNLTQTSSHILGDIIGCLQPHTLYLHDNLVKDISTEITTTSTVKVLGMRQNGIMAKETTAMMICLEELVIPQNQLGDYGVELLSEGISNSKTLRVLNICMNNIGPLGTIAIANALTSNSSLKELHMDHNEVGQGGAMAITEAITNNKTLKRLSLVDDTMDEVSALIIIKALHYNNTFTVLNLSYRLQLNSSIKKEVIKINSRRNKCNLQFFYVR